MQFNKTNLDLVENKFKNARNNILLMVIFSLVNILLLIFNGNLYFLFSASIPYFIVDTGKLMCGLYPAEYYNDLLEINFLPTSAITVFVGVAAAILILYFLCFVFSKNKKSTWLIVALVLFSIDTAALIFFMAHSLTSLIDVAFHVWVIISLARGIRASVELNKIEESNEQIDESVEKVNEDLEEIQDSAYIRVADTNVKHRMLLEYSALGHKIQYRRVKRVNELVIDGYVYGEYEALVESVHFLIAVIDGHFIEVGFDGFCNSYIKIDSKIVAKKIRII